MTYREILEQVEKLRQAGATTGDLNALIRQLIKNKG